MPFTPATPASLAAFVAVVVAVATALPVGTYWAHRRLGLPATRPALGASAGLVAWLALVSAVVASGAIERRPMPCVPLLLAAVNLAALVLGLSPLGGRLAAGLPLAALVGFQAFRLPLELVLHVWADHGTIPHTMTWTGQNLDILSGIVALLAAPLAGCWRWAAWVANLVGLTLLANVARVAILSFPRPCRLRGACSRRLCS
jgi:hypothetical protein